MLPPPGSSWRFNKDELPRLIDENRLWFGADGNGVPRIKRFLNQVKDGVIAQTIWLNGKVGNTQEAKKEVIAINNNDIFETPKPERLIKQIIEISSNPNDLILDSFAGSGTTGAVAQKMGRKFIMVEMGEHAHTHIAPRLAKVTDGTDQGGISKALEWQGGSGFRYCNLGTPLFDEFGNISEGVTFQDLAAHVFFCETGSPIPKRAETGNPIIGTFQGRAIYLLYDGDNIGFANAKAGNVLSLDILNNLEKPLEHNLVIYGEGSTLSPETLRENGAIFKQIPYQIEGL